MLLWYMASQNYFGEMPDKFDLSQSSTQRIICQVLTIVSSTGPTFISWPNRCEKAASATAFHHIWDIEAVDGCHIRAQRPLIRGGDYINRKAFYSILFQGIVDERGCFTDIFVGPAGRVHDAIMLRASTFYNEWQYKMGEYCLLGALLTLARPSHS